MLFFIIIVQSVIFLSVIYNIPFFSLCQIILTDFAINDKYSAI